MYNLSIIIPHYNSIDTLTELIKTIPTNNDEIEVIIIDDNSQKKEVQLSWERLVIHYQDKTNFKFLKNFGGSGAGSCRNLGLSVATGRWILFADDDDYFIDGFYDEISKDFSTEFDVIFYTPISLNKSTGRVAKRHQTYKKLIDDLKENRSEKNEIRLRYLFMVPWSKLIRQEFIEKYKIKFDEVMSSNDVMFSTKVGHYMTNFKVRDEIIYCVTRDSNSLTTNLSKESFFTRLDVFTRYFTFLRTKLSKKEVKYLDVGGMDFIIKSFIYKLSVKDKLKVLFVLKKNRVPLLKKEYLNPKYLYSKVNKKFLKYKNEKKFYN